MDRNDIIKLVTDSKIKLDDEIMLVLNNKGKYKYIQAQLRGIDIIKEKVTYTELDYTSCIDEVEFNEILNIRKLDIDKRCYDLTEPKSFNKSFDAVNSEILDIINGEIDTLEDDMLGKDVVMELEYENLSKETVKGVLKTIELWSINIENGMVSIEYLITVKDEFEELKAYNSKFIKSFKIGLGGC